VCPLPLGGMETEPDDQQHYKTRCCLGSYQDASLKSQTRARRGEALGRRTRVSAKIPIPKGAEWQKFLKESHNKDDLFQFLSEQLAQPLAQGISSPQRLNAQPTN